MSKEKTLAKNTLVFAIGNFGSKFLGFILLPFYTFYLSPEDYGYFDLLSNFLLLMAPIITFQMNEGVYRFLLDAKDEDGKKRVISTSIIVLIRNIVITNLLYLIIIQFLDFRFKYLALIQLNATLTYTMWIQISRGIRENVIYSLSGVIYTGVMLLGNIIFIIVFNMKVEGLILSTILACLVVIIFVESRLRLTRYIVLKYKDADLNKKLIKYSLPLIPTTISWWFMNVSGRYGLSYFEGMNATGIYAIANKFSSVLIMVSSIFYLAWLESAILEYNSENKNKFYTNIFNLFMVFQFTIVIVLLPVTKMVILFLLDTSYQSSWRYVPFLYIAAIFSGFSSFYDAGYLGSKNTTGSSVTAIIGAVTNVIFNVILIPFLGIQGAGLGILLAFLTTWLVRVYQTRKYFNIKINKRKIVILMLLTISYTYFYYWDNTMIDIIMFVVSILIFIVFNSGLIKQGILILKQRVGHK